MLTISYTDKWDVPPHLSTPMQTQVGDLVETFNGVSVRDYTLDGLKELTIGAEVRCALIHTHAHTHKDRAHTHTQQGTKVEVEARRDGWLFTVTLTRIYPELKNVTNSGIRQLLR